MAKEFGKEGPIKLYTWVLYITLPQSKDEIY